MKYRIGHILATLLPAVLLQGCLDDSYNGVAPDGSSSYYAPQQFPVLLVIGTPENASSKGSGAIDYDKADPWADKPLYFYAFKRDLATSFASLSKDNIDCLVDGSKDDAGSLAGKAARKNTYDRYISWTGAERGVVYPTDYIPYDFYGYFIDDIEVSSEDIDRTDESIAIRIEIDGSQDVMSSFAELDEEQLSGQDITDKEKTDITNLAFSSFTAERNIHPTFIFDHHLTRLRFDLYPGSEEAKDVYVDSIKVYSKTKGVFTVAHKSVQRIGIDFSADTEYIPLALTEEDGSKLKEDTYHTSYEGDFDGPVYDRDKTTVGGSILAAPDSRYEVHLYFKRPTRTGHIDTHEHVFTITVPGGSFSPGMQYTVRIAVYELQSIDPTVSVEEWEYGGDAVFDEDEMWPDPQELRGKGGKGRNGNDNI